MNKHRELHYAAAGAVSGAIWFVFPWQWDSGWALPSGVSGRLAGFGCAVFTGLTIAYLFRSLFRRVPLPLFLLLPVLTLPTAIVVFSLLLWLTRLACGTEFNPSPRHGEFLLILESYLFYGLLAMPPVLWILALFNQYAMRQLLNRNG